MECGMDTIPGGKLESVGNLIDLPLDLERTNVAGDSASCRAGGVICPGWTTTPGPQGGRGEWEHVGHPQSPCVSALPAGGGCGLSPTLSRSLGTSGLQLEPPMALPSTGRAGVGSRVWEKTAPAVLILLAVCPEVPSEFLYLPLSLAVCLGMVTGGQAHRDS